MKGQTSMAVIVIAIVLLVFLTIFLLTTTEPAGNAEAKLEYRNLFATNMLLSILNTETADCGSLSDMLKTEYLGGGTCGDEFGVRIEKYVEFLLIASGHTDYEWLIEVSQKNLDGTTMQWGNPVAKEKGKERPWDASTIIMTGGVQLEVKLYMKTK
jgi:hypothetical protein